MSSVASARWRALVALVRSALDVDDQPLALPPSRVHWESLADLALTHSLGSLAYSAVRRLDEPPPHAPRKKLQASYVRDFVRTEHLLEPTIRRALAALQRVGLEPVVLKGAALAYDVYPEPALRPMADFDLLLPAGQLGAARLALENAGFRIDESEHAVEHHLQSFYWQEERVGVEVHQGLVREPSPFRLEPAPLLARSVPLDVAGVETRVLAPDDALLLTCLHLSQGHRYRWRAAVALADVLAITAGHAADLDWERLLRTTREARCDGAVYWPLLIAAEVVGADVPDVVLTSLAPPPLLRRLAQPAVDPSWILRAQVEPGRPPTIDETSDVADAAARELLLDLSLLSGCPSRTWIGAIAGRVFPPREAIGHLPSAVTASRLRYAAHVGNPLRLGRGLLALGRMVLLRGRALASGAPGPAGRLRSGAGRRPEVRGPFTLATRSAAKPKEP